MREKGYDACMRYIYLRLPEDCWDNLLETLEMDMESSMLDAKIQEEIAQALANTERIDNRGEVEALDSARGVK